MVTKKKEYLPLLFSLVWVQVLVEQVSIKHFQLHNMLDMLPEASLLHTLLPLPPHTFPYFPLNSMHLEKLWKALLHKCTSSLHTPVCINSLI